MMSRHSDECRVIPMETPTDRCRRRPSMSIGGQGLSCKLNNINDSKFEFVVLTVAARLLLTVQSY